MAEAIFRNVVSQRLGCSEDHLARNGFDILSAGVAAGENFPASRDAVELLRDRGIDLSEHLSRQVTSELLSKCDRVYAMTQSHLAVLEEARPDLSGRMYLVTVNGRDVSDPIGGGPDVYRQCADEITEAISKIADELLRKDDAAT